MDAEIGEYFGTLLPSHFGDFTTGYAAARSAGASGPEKEREKRVVGTLLISLAARSGGVHIVGAIFMGFYFDAAKEMQRGSSPTGGAGIRNPGLPNPQLLLLHGRPFVRLREFPTVLTVPTPPACEAVLRFPILSLLYISPM